ncbi:hypothetical protein PIB30_078451 [Stylosanthes scabra]|uniref:Uncharacterized protein n=1 Tax=Stylosanthes scabra TaxID=79078 RepID=A0ABU6RQP3_9FABA|nr:hypothetical protein [Stylosanthes scabra]
MGCFGVAATFARKESCLGFIPSSRRVQEDNRHESLKYDVARDEGLKNDTCLVIQIPADSKRREIGGGQWRNNGSANEKSWWGKKVWSLLMLLMLINYDELKIGGGCVGKDRYHGEVGGAKSILVKKGSVTTNKLTMIKW